MSFHSKIAIMYSICLFVHLLFAVDNPPSFTCPSPISRPNVAGEAYANISWPEITLTDDYTPTGSLQVTGKSS